ncbi:MAG: M1 family aminopeptidase, partial [Flavisolibacter sp.]
SQKMTVNFKQENVHDFAWFADKRFWMAHDTLQLPSGRTIDLFTYYLKKGKSSVDDVEGSNGIDFAKSAIRFYSNEVGEYPYNVASVIEGPESFGGGMEYPTITIISPISDIKTFDQIVAHELGHNWFYGILASNERMHPWMDEGMNSFYDAKYMKMKYGSSISGALDLVHQTKSIRKTDQPIETTSEKFTATNYGLIAYFKTAAWMRKIENELGVGAFKKLMQDYFNKWKFKHPYPEDFEELVKTSTNKDLQYLFEAPGTKGILRGDEPKGFRVVSPFIKNSIKSYISKPSKNILFISPALGINSYDRLMLGGFISNYKLPPNNFQFLAIPMYATGSKKFAGLAKFNYSIHSDKAIRKADIFLNAANFSMDEFEDTAGRKLFMRFNKLVPGFRLTFREKEPRSSVQKFIQWKTFFFREQSLRIIPDTIINGNDSSLILHYLLPSSDSYINQLQFSYNNFRALYPFDIKFLIEQSKDFIRPSVTANYFFNYREGGLQLRFFAGKFIYLNGKTISKQFLNDRYLLNMTGARGYEDYTYSDYFLGRNHFEGLESQQIMMRDGGFKVRTDLLASKIGKTDNWLTAINLSSSIPDKINPLSVLPFKIPLRLFFDVGTYAEAWEKDAEGDRFLYDAGLHIPVLREMINIYIPLLYNKVYDDYFKSTIPDNRFLKKISFTINFFNKDLEKLNREVEF